MDPIRNPYAPGAGVQPPELTGRTEFLERARIAIARTQLGRPAKSFIAVGLRGVGKTVLLNRIAELGRDANCRTAVLEAHEDKPLPALLLPEMRRLMLELDRLGAISEQAKRALRTLKSFARAVKLKYGEVEIGLDIDPEVGSADSGDLEADLPELFVALGQAARARGVAVLLVLDEIQYLSELELSALIMALHRSSQLGLPILFAGAGLPQVVGLTGRSKSYAERLFDFPVVDALSQDDAKKALVEPAGDEGIEFTEEALHEILRLTQGYPYFLQEWGYHVWNVAASSPILVQDVERATILAVQRLDESFFRVRFDRLTPSEKRYVRAMAELGPGPHRSGEIAGVLGVKVTTVGPVRDKLIAKGMIYSPQHGDTAFTVPLFDEFLRRALPLEQGAPRRT
ncbi:MAG: ATP-binding protein [Acetobacteraceae bacterium]|nr:ATP-binding protein [Acetobacteraceae bacterium]